MLEVHKELQIEGEQQQLEALVQGITDRLRPLWIRTSDREDELAALDRSRRIYVFKSDRVGNRPAVSLFLALYHGTLSVTNIVPQDPGSLTTSEYNAILDDFAAEIRPLLEASGPRMIVTSDRRDITHWVSEDTARRLRSFSRMANKGTGSGHPLDFGRWAEFLIAAHQERSTLDAYTLQRWLIEEEHWPEEKAIELAGEFEFARELLKAYDSRR